MDDWEAEIEAAHHLFNETLRHLPEFIPTSKEEFSSLADGMRPFINPDLALFADVDGKSVAFLIALPDLNQALVHLNGRLLPFGWLRIRRLIREIDVVSFKLMGVLEEYRKRGIDALLYMEIVKVINDQGYQWLDGSLSSEHNPMINLIAQRLGAERYKWYRLYRMKL
jgi:GNAT superfamily N-acetyltransferase